MAVQRKVFHIEESARKRAPDGTVVDAESAERQRRFLDELNSLRALLAQPAPVDRSTTERARAQIAEAQAYKGELDLIYAAVASTRDGGSGHADNAQLGERAERVGRELEAIVAGTERATEAILTAAEEIGAIVADLFEGFTDERDKRLAHDIHDRVVQIFEACNFQDVTSQRAANVVAALKFIEDHAARLKTIWQSVEAFKPVAFDEPDAGDRHYLNGPKLPGDSGHATQDDIDGMFGCA